MEHMMTDQLRLSPENAADFSILCIASDLAANPSVKSVTKSYRKLFKNRATTDGMVAMANDLLVGCIARDWREMPKTVRDRVAILCRKAAQEMAHSGVSMNEALKTVITHDRLMDEMADHMPGSNGIPGLL